MGTDAAIPGSSASVERGLSANALARQVPCDKALISRYRSGRQDPSARMARRIDEVLGADGRLAGLAAVPAKPEAIPGEELADEIGGLELARRAAASDVGTATVERLELVADNLAIAYHSTPRLCSWRACAGIGVM